MDTVTTPTAEHAALAESLAADGVEFAVGGFVDITGRSKSKVVPISHLPNLLSGSERYTPRGMGELGQMTPNEDECVAMPDPAALRICPWDRRFAFRASFAETDDPTRSTYTRVEDARREVTSWQWAVYLVLALLGLATLVAVLSGVIDNVVTF